MKIFPQVVLRAGAGVSWEVPRALSDGLTYLSVNRIKNADGGHDGHGGGERPGEADCLRLCQRAREKLQFTMGFPSGFSDSRQLVFGGFEYL